MNKQQELKDRIYKYWPEGKTTYHKSNGNNLRCSKCGELDNYDNVGKCLVAEFSPIHLEHVLRAINAGGKEVLIGSDTHMVAIRVGNMIIAYNLSKTFDQNITDNPELLDLLLEVIK